MIHQIISVNERSKLTRNNTDKIPLRIHVASEPTQARLRQAVIGSR